ncbi:hypothetical protein [Haloglycomyces albus]|uniref:hypothetical protein n=1 Tax=Haloglycomyces albus TaxID=526067 RepID=UPI00046CE938|nr:hypothetical protein [Haloglycomyces albus]
MAAETSLSDQDKWEAFVSHAQADPAPPRLTWWKRALHRVIRCESLYALVISVAAAVAFTWPLAAHLDDGVLGDLGDPMLQTYTLAWLGHALKEGLPVFGTNTLWPAPDSLLFSDTLLGYLPAGALIHDQSSALVVYNLLFIASFALAAFSGYVLLRQLGARMAGSAVGAAVFAFAPWTISQFGHIQVLSYGAIALSLAMLARGHGWSLREGFKPERQRPIWILLGWLTALWQFSIGAGLGVPFVYLLAVLALAFALAWLVKRPRLKWGTLAANALGGVTFSLAVLWLADKHAAVAATRPEASRDLDYIQHFSPTWQSFILAPEKSWLWGDAHAAARADLTWQPEQTLLIGFTALALALAGLVWSSWSRTSRWVLGLSILVLTALSLGPNFLDNGAWAWGLLYEYVPGFDAIRTPGRLIIYLTLLVAILAAGTLTHLADRADRIAHLGRIDPRRRGRAPRRVQALFFLPLLLVAVEAVHTDQRHSPPAAPVEFSALEEPILVLPTGGNDGIVQFWSIDGFPDTVNGITAFTPTEYTEIQRRAEGFPSVESVRSLQEAGISTVVVIPQWARGTEWEQLDVDDPPGHVDVERRPGAVVYSLD